MNLKEELQKLKNKLLAKNDNVQSDERPYKVLATFEEIKEMEKQYYKEKNGISTESLSYSFSSSLNAKVEKFIKWYKDNMYENFFDNTPEEVRNFIEKMAVWYELRYSDNGVIDMLYEWESSRQNYLMFNENTYINKTNEELDVLLNNNPSKEIFNYLEWDKFYNTRVFIDSLHEYEKELLRKPKYFWHIDYNGISLYLTAKGTIERARKFYFGVDKFDYKKLIGMNIKEALVVLKKEYPHRDEYEVMKRIKDYDNQCKFKEELLDCVMYRIMERGQNRVAAYRAFLFAKEFNRNIDIPLQYGLARVDVDLKKFIFEYLNAGGNKNLVCYPNYYSRESKFEKLDTITIQEIIDKYYKEWYEEPEKEEETTDNSVELKQRLVNVLAGSINQEELQREKVKQLRLERKLEKSKKL